MASAAKILTDPAGLDNLIGTIRRLGMAGPPYEVVGIAQPAEDGKPQMRVLLIESSEMVVYGVDEILDDPLEG